MNKFKSILIDSIIFGLLITALSLYSIHHAFAQSQSLVNNYYFWPYQTFAEDQSSYQEVTSDLAEFGLIKAENSLRELLNWQKNKFGLPNPLPISSSVFEELSYMNNVDIVPCHYIIPLEIWAVIPGGFYAVYIDGVFVGYIWIS